MSIFHPETFLGSKQKKSYSSFTEDLSVRYTVVRFYLLIKIWFYAQSELNPLVQKQETDQSNVQLDCTFVGGKDCKVY